MVLAVRNESAGHAAAAHIKHATPPDKRCLSNLVVHKEASPQLMSALWAAGGRWPSGLCGLLRRQQHAHAAVEVGPRLDLADAGSIRAFAATFRAQRRPLHVLVNNAGANYVSDALTPAGVPLLTQVPVLLPAHGVMEQTCSEMHATSLCTLMLAFACSSIACRWPCNKHVTIISAACHAPTGELPWPLPADAPAGAVPRGVCALAHRQRLLRDAPLWPHRQPCSFLVAQRCWRGRQVPGEVSIATALYSTAPSPLRAQHAHLSSLIEEALPHFCASSE